MSNSSPGPFVKRLIAARMAVLMIPPGTPNPFATGIQALIDPSRLVAAGKEATEWVQHALALVKAAPDNPYGGDDEVIAAALLHRMKEKRDAD